MRLRRPVASSVAGLILGAVVIVVLTAVLTAGVSGLRADARTRTLLSQVRDLHRQNDELQASLVTATSDRASAAAQIDALLATNRTLVSQNRAVRAQLDLVIAYLHAHGLEVPQVVIPPAEAPTGPKAHLTTPGSSPHPSPAPSPSPSPAGAGTPSTPTPSPGPRPPDPIHTLCQLTPLLCTTGSGG